MKLTSIEGNGQWLDGGAMFGHAPKALWSRWTEVNENNCIPLACRSLVLEIADLCIVLEMGVGAYMDPDLSSRYGIESGGHLMLRNFEAAGFKEEDVDYVILSHLHFDHAGGLVPDWPAIKEDNWQPYFPNAKYLVGKEQFDRALYPLLRDRASYIPELNQRLQESGRLVLVTEEGSGTELDQHIEWVFGNGHTPGLLHALIKGENQKVFFCSDTIPGRPWLHVPIVTAYDRFSEKTASEKQDMLKRAQEENWLMFYTHDPKACASFVNKNEKGKYEEKDAIETMIGYSI